MSSEEQQVKQAISAYFEILDKGKGLGKRSKVEREAHAERKEQLETVLKNYMRQKGVTFIQVGEQFIVLKEEVKKRQINAEFLVHVYEQFRQSYLAEQQKRGVVPKNMREEAMWFAQYTYNFQRHLGEKHITIKVQKRAPMQAVITQMAAAPPMQMSGTL